MTKWSDRFSTEEIQNNLKLAYNNAIKGINNMQPHQQRVVDEKNELGERLEKLLAFRQTELYKSLPEQEQELLYFQSQAMKHYHEILEQRIELF